MGLLGIGLGSAGSGVSALTPETFHWSPILYSLLVVSFTAGKIDIDIVFNVS